MNTTFSQSRINQLKKEWRGAEVAENSATTTKIIVVREFIGYNFKCQEIADILEVGKSYISKVIKVAKYLDENKVTNRDFKRWSDSQGRNTLAVLYTAIGSIDKSETEINNPLDLLESKLNSADTVEKARGKKGAKSSKKSSKKSAEKVSVDKNNMVDIHHDGKHYRIPLDILNNYLVK